MSRYGTEIKFTFAILHGFMHTWWMGMKKPSTAFIRDCIVVNKKYNHCNFILQHKHCWLHFIL